MGEIALAVRSLLKSKLFTTVAVLTLAVGIGATTAVFSVYNAVVLRALPVAQPDRLVDVSEWSATELCADCAVGMSAPMLADVRQRSTTMQSIVAYAETGVNLSGRDAPERVQAAGVSGNFFGTLGIAASQGRALDPTDELPGAPAVAVISERLFQRRFGGSAGAIGSTIRVNGVPTRLVGVMPATAVIPEFAQLWLPLTAVPAGTTRDSRELGVIGRLRDDATIDQADAELRKIAADLEVAYPETQKSWTARARLLRDDLASDTRGLVGIILGAVFVLWAVVCANLAALVLARGVARRKELAVRLALGGTRRAIIWHLFSESLCIALAGGVLGIIAASWVVEGVVLSLDPALPAWMTPSLDVTVLGFCVLLSLLSAAAFGLWPAVRISGPAIHDELKAGTQANVGGGRSRMRGALVVVQLSLSLMLLAVAGILSATVVSRSGLGENRNPDVVQARMGMLGAVPEEQVASTVRTLTDRLAAMAEARSAAASADIFIAGFGTSDNRIRVEGVPTLADGVSPRFAHSVTPRFFETTRLPIAAGRAFSDADRAGSNPVVIINRKLADRLWPGETALGRRIKLGDDSLLSWMPAWRTVVGVVADVDTARGVRNAAYVPFSQAPIGGFTLYVAAKGEPASLLRPMREVARAVAPDLPLLDQMTPAQAHAMTWRPIRAYAATISTIGSIALVLAAIGLYGLVAYGAEQRTREIGLRIALGARRRDVVRLVTRQGLALVGFGLVFGLAAAALVAPLMKGLLFGASPINLFVFGGSAAVLVVVAAFASYLPARRAASTDPMVALRSE